MTLRVLDLFSGIGGFSLGLERAGMQTVAFCEIDPYCRKVLAKHWPEVPIYEDVRTLRGADVGAVDLISGGYPCQPFSVAGERLGEEDDRHLWPEFARLVAELRPAWVCGENVAGHISMGLDDVLSDLEDLGYQARTFVIPAAGVGAPHKRDRVWTIAHAHGADLRDEPGRRGGSRRQGAAVAGDDGAARALANALGEGQLQPEGSEREKRGRSGDGGEQVALADAGSSGSQRPRKPRVACDSAPRGQRKAAESFDGRIGSVWSAEPDVGRVADGVPARVDRLKALGNAVVPQIPELIGRAILAADADRKDVA